MLVTVNVMFGSVFDRRVTSTLQAPPEPVVHLPVAPVLQVPLTIALETVL